MYTVFLMLSNITCHNPKSKYSIEVELQLRIIMFVLAYIILTQMDQIFQKPAVYFLWQSLQAVGPFFNLAWHPLQVL